MPDEDLINTLNNAADSHEDNLSLRMLLHIAAERIEKLARQAELMR